MRTPKRIQLVTFFVSVLVGLVVATVLYLGGEPISIVLHHLSTANGLANTLFVGGVASLPISVPAGLVGGYLAARVTCRTRGDDFARLVCYGALAGAAIGSAIAVTWCALMSLGNEFQLTPFTFFAAIGAVAGLLAGCVVGVYCACLVRSAVRS